MLEAELQKRRTSRAKDLHAMRHEDSSIHAYLHTPQKDRNEYMPQCMYDEGHVRPAVTESSQHTVNQ